MVQGGHIDIILYFQDFIILRQKFFDFLNYWEFNKRFVKQYLSKEVGLNKLGVNDVMNTWVRDYMHYIISYLTAIELYLMYQDSPQKALDLLFSIISIRKDNSKEYLDYVITLGLEPGKNFDKYVSLLFEKAKEVKDGKSLRYNN